MKSAIIGSFAAFALMLGWYFYPPQQSWYMPGSEMVGYEGSFYAPQSYSYSSYQNSYQNQYQNQYPQQNYTNYGYGSPMVNVNVASPYGAGGYGGYSGYGSYGGWY